MPDAPAPRADDLLALKTDLQARMAVAESDQNFAVMGRLLVEVLKQLDEVSAPAEEKGSVLSEFERRLKDRESDPARPRRTKS